MTTSPVKKYGLLAALIEIAEQGRICPSDTGLIPASGYNSASGVRNVLAELEEEGLISRSRVRGQRVITIVATGKKTAERSVVAPDTSEFRRRPVREIAEMAAHIFNVPTKDIISDSKFDIHTKPRFAVYRVAVDQGWPLSHVGRVLKRDHSSVLHGRRKAAVYANECRDYAQALGRLAEAAAMERAG